MDKVALITGVEQGYDKKTGRLLVTTDPMYLRPNEVPLLLGNPTKANKVLGWTAQTMVPELCEIMLRYDIDLQRGTL